MLIYFTDDTIGEITSLDDNVIHASTEAPSKDVVRIEHDTYCSPSSDATRTVNLTIAYQYCTEQKINYIKLFDTTVEFRRNLLSAKYLANSDLLIFQIPIR
jgi:hypothetical protein